MMHILAIAAMAIEAIKVASLAVFLLNQDFSRIWLKLSMDGKLILEHFCSNIERPLGAWQCREILLKLWRPFCFERKLWVFAGNL